MHIDDAGNAKIPVQSINSLQCMTNIQSQSTRCICIYISIYLIEYIHLNSDQLLIAIPECNIN